MLGTVIRCNALAHVALALFNKGYFSGMPSILLRLLLQTCLCTCNTHAICCCFVVYKSRRLQPTVECSAWLPTAYYPDTRITIHIADFALQPPSKEHLTCF